MEADGLPTINIEGGVMQFDDTNYIRQDQIPAIVSQASKQGEARALRRLQCHPQHVARSESVNGVRNRSFP